MAGLSNPSASYEVKAEIYKLLAQYFVSVATDYKKGEEFMLDALQNKNDVNGNLLIAQIYRMQGKYALAKNSVQTARQLDEKNVWFKEISIEDRNIRDSELSHSQSFK